MPTGGLDVAAGSFLAGTLGETAAGILGTAALGGEIGAGIGGLESAITGQPILKGAAEGGLGGALTGGGIGIGGDIASGLGAGAGSLGAIAGSGLGGAAGGALGATATGGNALTGALEGGLSGGISGSGILSGGGSTDSTGASSPSAQPSGVPQGSATAGASGGGAAGGASAPAGLNTDSFDLMAAGQQSDLPTNISSSLSNAGSAAIGSPQTNTPNIGNGTVGTQSLSPGTESFLGNLQGQATANAPVTDSLNPAVISADNAASPGGIGSLNQPSSISSLVGSTSPVDQSSSLASASQAAGAAATKAPNSIGQLFQPGGFTAGNIGTALANNGGALAALGGVGLDALKGNQQTGAEKNLISQAGAENAQGTALENYLQTGTLPAGEQAGVTQALNSAIASIKSRYASMGMSGSSAEQQDIANAQQQAQAATAQMQEQLLSTGINETGMSSQLYQELLKNSMANDTNLSNAIANFASAASGGGNFGKGGQIVLQTQG